jgi:hypothetical protein
MNQQLLEIDPTQDAPGLSAKPADLRELSQLCLALHLTQVDIAMREEELKELKAHARSIEEGKIPEFMSLAGVSSLTLEDGTKVEVTNTMTASVAGKTLPVVLTWLKEAGYDAMIKTEVLATFGKGQLQKATSVQEELRERGIDSKLAENVNTSSFKALMKELMEQGTPLPLEDLGVYVIRRAKITSSQE